MNRTIDDKEIAAMELAISSLQREVHELRERDRSNLDMLNALGKLRGDYAMLKRDRDILYDVASELRAAVSSIHYHTAKHGQDAIQLDTIRQECETACPHLRSTIPPTP